jgi:hypothetical protein
MSPHPDGKPPPQPRPRPAFDIDWLNYIRTTWYVGRAYMRVTSLATRQPYPCVLPKARYPRWHGGSSTQAIQCTLSPDKQSKNRQRTTRLQDKLAYQPSNSLGNTRSQAPRLGLMHLLGQTPRCDDHLDHGQEALPRTWSTELLREADLSDSFTSMWRTALPRFDGRRYISRSLPCMFFHFFCRGHKIS